VPTRTGGPYRPCTRAAAEQVRDAIAEHFHAHPGYGPQLMDEGWDGRPWTIVWDEGPDEWAYNASYQITPPAGCFLEPVNYCSLAIHEK
jgi:hypothetical protein